jgi:hypothetical protein
MKIYVLYKPNGMVTQSMTVNDDIDMPAVAQNLGQFALEITPAQHAQLTTNSYVANGNLIHPGMGPKGHDFDVASKTFVPNFTVLRNAKMALIDGERLRRSQTPIAYEGHTVSASPVSQTLLFRSVVYQIARENVNRPTPANQRRWYDVNGVMITFPSEQLFKTWISGLAVAIAERNDDLEDWMEAKRLALNALGDDANAIEAFDYMA